MCAGKVSFNFLIDLVFLCFLALCSAGVMTIRSCLCRPPPAPSGSQTALHDFSSLQSYLPISLLSRTALLTAPAFVLVHLLDINLLAACHVGVCSFAISNAPNLRSTAGPCRLAPSISLCTSHHSVLVGDRSKAEYENAPDPRQQQVNVFDFPYGRLIINLQSGGFEIPGTLINSVEIGQVRDKILSFKLDQVFSLLGLTLLYLTISQISGTTTSFSMNGTSTSVDPKDYLTSVESVILKSEVEIGNIKHARMLFDSLVKSNPEHTPGWIAAACLEEHAGSTVAARNIIKQCLKSEDVWLKAARLHVSSALFFLSLIVNYYPYRTTAMRKSSSPTSPTCRTNCQNLARSCRAQARHQGQKMCVTRKTPKHIPNSVCLRKENVNLESQHPMPGSSSLGLLKSSHCLQLWSALAPLESMNISTAISKFPKLYMVQGQIHQQQSNNTAARASFAAGIKSCPKEPTLWILASRLEEADGKSIKARQANPGNDLLWAKAARVCTGARVLWTHRVTERARD